VLGLYVHIPFCAAICNYCNFNRGLFDGGLKNRYLQALLTEISRAPSAPGPGFPPEGARSVGADTIFFGGGTPSLLQPHEIGTLIDACRDVYDLSPDAEITLEANPETVSEETLRGFLAAGVNRISFGVQSFDDRELVRLSRLHGADRARTAMAEARAAGCTNVSLDLMMWLPGQSVAQWLVSIESALALDPDHLSLYLLEIYPNAPLREAMARADWSQAPDDDAAVMYVEAMERLERAGFEQYEISNVAQPGYRSRHNLKYWRDEEWRGFGCGAHSTRSGTRWKNVSAVEDYIAEISRGGSAAVEVKRLTSNERLGDALFMGLRLTDGIDLDRLERRYGTDIWGRYGAELQPFVEEALLEYGNRRLRLTRRGMLLANEVMSVFV
jgi:oxygen-independent coproporphyrinogen-3 oxidase